MLFRDMDGRWQAKAPNQQILGLEDLQKDVLKYIKTLANWPPEDLQEYLVDEVQKIRYDRFSTSIKHFLQIAF